MDPETGTQVQSVWGATPRINRKAGGRSGRKGSSHRHYHAHCHYWKHWRNPVGAVSCPTQGVGKGGVWSCLGYQMSTAPGGANSMVVLAPRGRM